MPSVTNCAVGIDLGGTNIKFGVVSEDGTIVEKTSLKTNADGGPREVLLQIKKGIKQILPEKKFKVEGIGIGSPGVVSIEKGTVENPPNFPGWKSEPLAKYINEEFDYKVYLENDANAAAIGEMIFGAGKDYASFIMITLGTGVGGGIVLNRKIFRGEYGVAGEIGHITVHHEGPKCNCGSIGCIETFIGNNYLKERIKSQLKDNPDSLIWNLIERNPDKLTPKIIQEAAEQGDDYARFAITEMGRYLGAALASVSNLLDVSTFIIGGGVAGFGKPLLDAIYTHTHERVLKSLKERIKILPAELKNDAGILGASALVFLSVIIVNNGSAAR